MDLYKGFEIQPLQSGELYNRFAPNKPENYIYYIMFNSNKLMFYLGSLYKNIVAFSWKRRQIPQPTHPEMFNISQGSWVKMMFRIPFLGGIHITEAETLAKEIKFENEANGQMSLGRDSDISRYRKRCRGIFFSKKWKAKLSLKMGMQMEDIQNIQSLNGWRKMMEVFARLTRKIFFEKNKSIQKLYATFLETCDWKIHTFFLCKKTRTTSRQLSRCQGFIV